MTTPDVEQRLVEIWRAVLGRPELPASASFFQSGGDSLLATQLVARLRTELGKPTLSVRAVFRAPSPTEFAALLPSL